jgi:hypothetical protein
MPVGARTVRARSTLASGRGPLAAPEAQRAAAAGLPRDRPAARAAAGASATLFQVPQEAQRPNQRGSSWPHAEQKKWGFAGFAMGG